MRSGFRSPTEGMRAAKKVAIDGFTFDSKAEAARYGELKLMLAAGTIMGLEIHPAFRFVVNGVRVAGYKGDFMYKLVLCNPDVNTYPVVVEDVKSGGSRLARDYRLRLRLMKACHGIDVVEVDAQKRRKS